MTRILLPILIVAIFSFAAPSEGYKFEVYDRFQKEKKEENHRKALEESKEDQRRHQRDMLRRKQEHEKDMQRLKQKDRTLKRHKKEKADLDAPGT